MRQALLGLETTRWMPLPVERQRRAEWKPLRSPAALREVPYVYDLGCGDGRIVVTAARTFRARGVGVEIDPERIKECRANAASAGVGDRVDFLQQSFFEVDFSPATVVTLYLLPWVNAILRPRLLEQLRPGSRIVARVLDAGLDAGPDHPDPGEPDGVRVDRAGAGPERMALHAAAAGWADASRRVEL